MNSTWVHFGLKMLILLQPPAYHPAALTSSSTMEIYSLEKRPPRLWD